MRDSHLVTLRSTVTKCFTETNSQGRGLSTYVVGRHGGGGNAKDDGGCERLGLPTWSHRAGNTFRNIPQNHKLRRSVQNMGLPVGSFQSQTVVRTNPNLVSSLYLFLSCVFALTVWPWLACNSLM